MQWNKVKKKVCSFTAFWWQTEDCTSIYMYWNEEVLYVFSEKALVPMKSFCLSKSLVSQRTCTNMN